MRGESGRGAYHAPFALLKTAKPRITLRRLVVRRAVPAGLREIEGEGHEGHA